MNWLQDTQLKKFENNNNHHILVTKNEDNEKVEVLFSYETPVVMFNTYSRVIELSPKFNYSKTTKKYVNLYVAQSLGLDSDMAKELINKLAKEAGFC